MTNKAVTSSSVTLLEVVLMHKQELIDNCNWHLNESLNAAFKMGERGLEEGMPAITCVKRLILEELNPQSSENLKAPSTEITAGLMDYVTPPPSAIPNQVLPNTQLGDPTVRESS